MAEIWGAAIIAGGALVGGAMQSSAAKKAAKSGNAAAQAGIDEQRAAREQFQNNISPYLTLGQSAIPQLQALNSGDYSGFMNSPDYLVARQMGAEQLDAGATANGNLWGGGADADRIKLGSDLATLNLGNYRNSLMGTISLGQNAAVGAGSLGQQSANQISGLYGNIGQNNANSAINQGNAWSGAIGNIAGAAGQYFGGRQSSYSQPTQQGFGQPASGWGQQSFSAQQPWYGNNYGNFTYG